jgi:hypothetical protein
MLLIQSYMGESHEQQDKFLKVLSVMNGLQILDPAKILQFTMYIAFLESC